MPGPQASERSVLLGAHPLSYYAGKYLQESLITIKATVCEQAGAACAAIPGGALKVPAPLPSEIFQG
jgi:hypothetical protein